MDFVYIERRLWNVIRDHARHEAPNECIGFFEAKPEGAGNLRITAVWTCKNVSRQKKDSGMLSKVDERRIKQFEKIKGKEGYVYGVYHSHPATGTIYLSEKDSLIGKIYKRFRHQLIAGVYGKSKKVRTAFWFYKRPRPWQEVEIMIKRRNNA